MKLHELYYDGEVSAVNDIVLILEMPKDLIVKLYLDHSSFNRHKEERFTVISTKIYLFNVSHLIPTISIQSLDSDESYHIPPNYLKRIA